MLMKLGDTATAVNVHYCILCCVVRESHFRDAVNVITKACAAFWVEPHLPPLRRQVLSAESIHPKSAHLMSLYLRKSVQSASSAFYYYPFIDFKGLRVMCKFRAPIPEK